MKQLAELVFYIGLALYFFGVPFPYLEIIIAVCAAIKAVVVALKG